MVKLAAKPNQTFEPKINKLELDLRSYHSTLNNLFLIVNKISSSSCLITENLFFLPEDSLVTEI